MIGDHIRTLKAGRWTHAIDCGDETVIVLAEDPAQAARVRRSYRPDFVAGAESVEVVLHRERTFPAEEVVARAYSRISDPALASMFRDSEAFAEWCTTGRVPTTPPSVSSSVPGVTPAEAPRRVPTVAPRKKKPAARAKPKAKVKAKPARAARRVSPSRKPAKASARKTATKKKARRSRQ